MNKSKKMIKQIFLILLTSLFCIQLLNPVPVYAAKDEAEQNKEKGSGTDYLPFEFKLGTKEKPGISMDYNDNYKKQNNATKPTTQGAAWTEIMVKYRVFIVGCAGAATLTLLLIWLYLFTKMGTSATNPMERRKASQSLVLCGIATALLGSVTLFTGLFLYIFR